MFGDGDDGERVGGGPRTLMGNERGARKRIR